MQDRFTTLDEWLCWQEQLHPTEIELGLHRIKQVWANLQADLMDVPVITVAGTNGKGSCVAMLDAIYSAAGYSTAVYTSPHLYRYNERIRIRGVAVGDDEIVAAFACVDRARNGISLTYFEFGTLAALYIFSRKMQSNEPLDVVILEVGLGGRLDAVNIIEPDAAMIASVDLDHQDYLGETREQIGLEKAGIFRRNKPAIICDPETPAGVFEYAREIGSQVYLCDADYRYEHNCSDGSWSWHGPQADKVKSGLPTPSLSGAKQIQNAAGVLMAITALADRLPVAMQAIRQGLMQVKLSGRFEVRQNRVTTILDVAHNPAAARVLAQSLRARYPDAKIRCVFAILADKDISNVAAPLLPLCADWNLGRLDHPRAATVESVRNQLHRLKPELTIFESASVAQAYRDLLERCEKSDVILVFGSFYTVAEVGSIAV